MPQSRNDARTYDGLNRDAAIAALPGGYDAKGNLTSDGTRTFGYDDENRLLTVTGPTSLTLAYDPVGRLRQTVSATTTTNFGYEGAKLSAEYGATGNAPLRRYVHGPATDEPLVWYEGAGVTDKRYYHQNWQGSIIATSTAVAAGTQVYSYGPWGEPDATQGWSGSRFRYTGQTLLAEAKLYYYKARVYDPEAGRFLQTDPIGTKDDLNLYAYVANDPVNATDPTGTETRSNGRNWVLIPGIPGFGRTEVPRPWLAPQTLNGQTSNFHAYNFSHRIVGAGRVPDAAFQAIMNSNPVPNPFRSGASVEGTRNDATAPGPMNGVMSYIRTGDGGQPLTVNVTRTGEHALAHGWVATTHQ